MENKLSELRGEIDRIDEQLVTLFCRRMELSAEIGKEKAARGLPVLVPEREENVRRHIEELAGEALAPFARALYGELLSLSRKYQTECLRGEHHE